MTSSTIKAKATISARPMSGGLPKGRGVYVVQAVGPVEGLDAPALGKVAVVGADEGDVVLEGAAVLGAEGEAVGGLVEGETVVGAEVALLVDQRVGVAEEGGEVDAVVGGVFGDGQAAGGGVGQEESGRGGSWCGGRGAF